MKRFYVILFVVFFVSGFENCATIVSTTKQDIKFNSTPIGATVVVGGQQYVTPITVKLKRNSSYKVTFTKEGYEPITYDISQKMNGWLVGNILFGGIIGIAVDFGTGAAYNLNPSEVNAVLTEKNVQEIGFKVKINNKVYDMVVLDKTTQ